MNLMITQIYEVYIINSVIFCLCWTINYSKENQACLILLKWKKSPFKDENVQDEILSFQMMEMMF